MPLTCQVFSWIMTDLFVNKCCVAVINFIMLLEVYVALEDSFSY